MNSKLVKLTLLYSFPFIVAGMIFVRLFPDMMMFLPIPFFYLYGLPFVTMSCGYLLLLNKIYNKEKIVTGAGTAFILVVFFALIKYILTILLGFIRFPTDGEAGFHFHVSFHHFTETLFYALYLFLLLVVSSVWRLFKKAGRGGWESVIPFYRLVVQCKIAKAPVWWVWMILFVPLANIFYSIMLADEFVHAYGKSTKYTIGIILLPFIFYPLLAYGDNKYIFSEKGAETSQAV